MSNPTNPQNSRNKFLIATSIVFGGTMVGNVLNYIFNVIMGWLLPPAVYGQLVSLVTLLLVVGVPASTLTIVVAKYTAGHWANEDRPAAAGLLKAMTQLSFIIGIIGFIIAAIASPFLASYLKIPITPIVLFGLLIPLSFLGSANSGFLQGIQDFVPLSFNSAIGSAAKLLLSILLIYLGYSLSGIITALIVASLLGYVYSRHFAMRATRGTTITIATSWRTILKDKQSYVVATFVAMLLLTIFMNVDVIMSKHYLAPDFAGQYAALSVLGKIITYGSGAILTVLFPLVSASHTRGDEKADKYFGISLAVVGGASLLLVLLFSFFPTFVLGLLFGTRYLAAAPWLVYFAAAVGFSSVASVFVQYFLAVHSTNFIYPLAVLTVAEIAGIVAFHANIHQIVLSSLITAVLLTASFIPIFFAIRNQNTNAPLPA